jgi:pantothenate kinase type III
MSDDRRKDKPKISPDNSEKSIALDSLGIPILEEVIAVENDYSFDEDQFAALTTQLRSQLKHNMGNIAGSMASVVVANISAELKQQIKIQITKILDQHLDRMINRAIADIAKGKNTN